MPVIHMQCRRRDILFGNYTAFRWPVNAADLIGCLGANRPICVEIAAQATFAEHLRQIWSVYVESQDFRRVVGARIAWDRHLNRIIANLSKVNEDVDVDTMPPPPGWHLLPVNHELALVLRETPSALRGCVSYSAAHFSVDAIKHFCNDFLALVRK